MPARPLSHLGSGLLGQPGFLMVAVLAAVSLLAVIWLSDHQIARFFHDDAFFVIKTAYHMGAGQGSTFDSVNLTNGYHPLNLWLLSVLSHFFPLKGGPGLDTVFLFDMVLTALGLLVLDRLAKDAGFTIFARMFSLIGIAAALAFNDFGLEARLLIPAAWAMMLLSYRSVLSGKPPAVWIGAAGAVVVLTRLDAVLFVLMIAFYVASRHVQFSSHGVKKGALIRFSSVMLPPSFALLGYSIYNWVAFSRPMTISSWLKFAWPIDGDLGWLTHPGAFGRVGFCLATAAVFYLVMIYSGRSRSPLRCKSPRETALWTLLVAANAYSVLYILCLVMFLRGEFGSWYLALPLSISFFTAAYVMTFFIDKVKQAPVNLNGFIAAGQVLIILAVLVAGVAFDSSKIARGNRDNAIDIGLWVRDNLPDHVRIYQVDESGFPAYFSERAIINGDGLINSWEYQRYLRAGALVEYLRKYGVEYVIWDNYQGEPRIGIPIRLWNEPPHLLSFSEEPQRVVRFGKFVLLDVDLSTAVLRVGVDDLR